MLLLKDVSKIYPNQHSALENVNLNLRDGEMVFLTGHSGAGKSTLLKLIANIEKPSSGEIQVGDFDLAKMTRRKTPLLRRTLGIISQTPHLLNDRNIFDNVALPLVILGFRPQEIKSRVRAALDKVGLLSKEKQRPESLSGGEQQRIEFARAVVHKPKLLIADEPTGNLDPELSEEIINLFAEFNQVGMSVLVATHDLSLIARLKYRIVSIKNGILKG